MAFAPPISLLKDALIEYDVKDSDGKGYEIEEYDSKNYKNNILMMKLPLQMILP